MKLNRVIKLSLSILMTLLIVLGAGQGIIYAETKTGTLYANIQVPRMVYEENTTGEKQPVNKWAYGLKASSGDDTTHVIYQILKVANSSDSASTIGKNLYCLNASQGTTWGAWTDSTGTVNGGIGKTATYDRYSELKDKDDIESTLIKNSDRGANINTYNSQLLWILDNMYIPDETKTKEQKDQDIIVFLGKIGIVKDGECILTIGGNEYSAYNYKYYDENVKYKDTEDAIGRIGTNGYCYQGTDGTIHDVLISEELIESVQQAVIWYYTNGYDFYQKEGWLKYKVNQSDTEYSPLSTYKVQGNNAGGSNVDIDIGNMYQEQANILYNYLIDNAEDAAENHYEGTENTTIQIEGTHNISENTDGTYTISNINITSTGPVSNIKIKVSDKDDNDITSQCTIPSTIVEGEEFDIIVPSSVDGNVKIIAEADRDETTKTIWGNSEKEEQPLVEVSRGKTPIESDPIIITNEKVFDLALRKIITGVKNTSGTTISIVNEDGLLATRTITEDISTIPNTNTATYKHRKDPVVVSKGYTVTYELKIYNEGDIKGYASTIVDQLPTGLKTNLSVNDTILSIKGNTYKVTSISDNKIVLEIQDTTPTVINELSGTTLDSDTITLEAEVTQIEDKNKHYLTNIAYIAEAKDNTDTVVARDRDNTESQPGINPFNDNKVTVDELNNTDKDSLYHGKNSYSIFNDNDVYFAGQEDDDDFETVVLLPKEFDLKLVKYISAVNGDTSKGKTITRVDTSKLNTIDSTTGNKITTADYTLNKDAIVVKTGDYVTYTIRIFNEGEIDGYATKITEDIPEGLEFVYADHVDYDPITGEYTYTGDAASLSDQDKAAIEFNMAQGWSQTSGNLVVSDKLKDTLLEAYDSTKTTEAANNIIKGLNYADVQIMLKVTSTDTKNIIRNEAAITEAKYSDGTLQDDTDYKDRDSKTSRWVKYEDDEDYDNIRLLRFDLALRKFISAVSSDITIDPADYLTGTKSREPKVNTTGLRAGTDTTAIYEHSKTPIELNAGDYVLYTIRVYNEGDVAGYASQVKDYLPTYLDFIDGEFNKGYGWKRDAFDEDGVYWTDYLASADKKLKEAFNTANSTDEYSSGLDHQDIQILCRVNSNAIVGQNITNIAEITKYKEDESIVRKDIDSTSDNLEYPTDVPGYKGNETGAYIPGQEDDDDFEKVKVRKLEFDLALRKFITKINDEAVTTRIPQVKYENGKITYEHPKNVVKVAVGDIVTYTIRVYNEGKIDGFAQTITDDIPEYLEYLPENEINIANRWKMYDKDGKETEDVSKATKIVSDYTSKENGEELMKDNEELSENPNYLTAFDPSKEISDTNPDYTEVKVAFKVKDPNSSKTVIVNKAQISEDCDKDGNPIIDVDSIPNEWNAGEDDQDYENVSVEYFDLSLLKYVSEVIVKENGTITTTKTGNNGGPKDIVPKVEIHRKRVKTTVVKFVYTIKVTNEGDVPGYATELTDYVPKGLEFHAEDNKGWTEKKSGVITTTLLKDTLLNPGESATVKVTFRWKNGTNNLGVKTNVAEISKDKNEKGIPDRDSTPGNKKSGEDDIDDADVLLSIKTGLTENIIAIIGGVAVILIVLAGGVILIKKFVL